MRLFINERILLYKISKGDVDAFGVVYDLYHEKIYRFVYLKVPTRQDTEDICAEVFLRAWRELREQKKVRALQAFLYQVARNLVVDFYRARGVVTESIDEQEVVIADRVDLSLEEKMMLKSDMIAVEDALRRLKDIYREVIILHYLNELSIGEVSRIVGKSRGAVRVLLHRGLKALKTLLSEEKEHDYPRAEDKGEV